MIVARPTDTKLESNVEGDRHEMTVDVSNMAHIMSILTDLYSDPEKAIIREYSTNAHDAHVEAGVTRPIEVTLPNALSPFLKIKDYGIGLDNEGIKRIYSQYGASTKRGTNEQNGMLGLGCKSALTYTNQFSLVGVKDGKAHSVVIERDEMGVGSMTVAQVLDTDEPNGVTVIIPVKRGNEIDRKAREFYRAWEPGTVLVNGEQPEGYDGLAVGDNMLVVDGSTDYVVMGNVAYPVEPNKIKHGISNGRYGVPNRALITFVKIGEVNFAPNREALMYNSLTETTLQRISAEFKANIDAAIQTQMDAEPSAAEAIKVMLRWRSIMGGNAASVYSYKGQPVPVKFEASRILVAPKVNESGGYRSRRYGNSPSGTESTSVEADKWPTTLFVYNYNGARLSPDQRRKLAEYMRSKGIQDTVERYAMLQNKPSLPWIEHTVDYEATIKPIKLTPTQVRQASGRPTGSYDLWDGAQGRKCFGVVADEIDQTRPVFYDANGRDAGSYDRLLVSLYPDAYIVHFPSTREAKFCRHFPDAKRAYQGVKDAYTKWLRKLTTEDKLALACERSSENEFLMKLDPTKVDDPRLARAIRVAQKNVDKLFRELQGFQRYLGALDIALPTWDTPLNEYPLLRDRYHGFRSTGEKGTKAHMYIYINAVYAAQTKGA